MTQQELAAARGWQTLRDALIAAVIVAGGGVLVGAIGNAGSWAEWLAGWQAWTWTFFQAVVMAVLTAVIAWAQRRYRDRSGASANAEAEG